MIKSFFSAIILAGIAIGAYAQTNVGIGTNNPKSKVDVTGNITVGAGYSGTDAAPVNGAIIQGQVGIGTSTPNASAALDITSSSQGVSFPNVALLSATDATTVATPKQGLIVYNTAAHYGTAGLYINDGSSTSPSWIHIVDASSVTSSIQALSNTAGGGLSTFTYTGSAATQIGIATGGILGTMIAGSTITSTNLAGTGVTSGTYNTVTVNAQGQVTSASNTTYQTPLTAGNGITISSGTISDNLWTASGSNIYNTASGNVGIDNSNPLGPLDIGGRAAATSFKVGSTFSDLTNNSPWYGIGMSNLNFAGQNPASFAVQIAGFYGINFAESGSNRMVINLGNVGIGTISPALLLQVNGTAGLGTPSGSASPQNGALAFYNSSNTNIATIQTGTTATSYTLTLPVAQASAAGQVLTNNGSGNLSWVGGSGTGTSGYWTRTGTTLYNSNTGDNVGIGQTSPNATLDVNGNIQISNATIPMGLMTEVLGTTPLLNLDVNFRETNKNTTYTGAALRIDTRPGYPMFNWITRAAGSTSEITQMVLTTSGDLGIGNSSPANLFSVGSSSQFQVNSSGAIAAAAGITSSGTITFSGLVGGSSGSLVQASSSGVLSVASTSTSLPITAGTGITIGSGNTINSNWTLSGANIYNNNSGNVGIGTTTPSAVLSITNTSGSLLNSTSASTTFNTYSGPLGSTLGNSLKLGSFGFSAQSGNLPSLGIKAVRTVAGTGWSSPSQTAIGLEMDVDAVDAAGASIWLNSTGYVGIGITSPITQLANTSVNILGSDGNGINGSSIAWLSNAGGYTLATYNASTSAIAQGLAVKIAGTTSTNRLLDLSTGSAQAGSGTSVMVVQGNGNVGIGLTAPSYSLDVTSSFRVSPADNSSSIVVSGGNATTSGTYTYVEYTGNGTFIIPTGGSSLTVEVLAIGGGGGGGANGGGGGGGGGVVDQTITAVAGTTYNILVGTGGTGQLGSVNTGPGGNGNPSSFIGGSVTVKGLGGGGGASRIGSGNSTVGGGATVGSGGGGSSNASNASISGGTAGTGGNNGGTGNGNSNNGGCASVGGGGGGAATAGAAGLSNAGGQGGEGISETDFSGFGYFSGGGGGGVTCAESSPQSNGGAGGTGGGGAGSNGGVSGTTGMANTGGGGGGGGGASSTSGGNGGSGIVILRYSTGSTTTSSGQATFVATAGGSVGIGTSSPLNLLDVNGGTAIGEYAGSSAAPSNGLIVSGWVGIGTSSPQAPLQVSGASAIVGNIAMAYFNSGGNSVNQTTWTNGVVSAYFTGNVLCTTSFISCDGPATFSDNRIKKIIGISDKSKDLETLNKVQITKYKYIDSIGMNNRVHTKVIAQQVEKVYPEAISYVTNFIPDIYEVAPNFTYDPHTEALKIDLDKAHHFQPCDRVKWYKKDGVENIDEVAAVDDSCSFTIFTKTAPAEVFVYGKEVHDFRVVDYDALSMLNISAVQELSGKVADLEKENEQLKATRAEVQDENCELKEQRTALSSNTTDIQLLKKQLDELKALMEKNGIRSEK